ncbi:hypothetical protein PPERSA_08067 [Pseudocohnilembus persalinus]|uniref:Transmembrane protein n=1 Tax=Pseudocohnilembus persalinus TaxID=266149 RepID=A0A0V0R2M7_PSEPJ|nr:hypothetical protein PPERSA_08067 [Pseudocohnilembus persalinus]|eukprot:KRX08756.1 hypothetical protein PPERSA_08067 [Pseudocohnilembus persalinus]
MSLFIFYILSICVKYCTSSAKQFLQNAKCREEIQMYHANVSKNPPKIQYHVQAYHWVTRRTKNGTSRRKVVTYKHDEELKYMSHQDQTENLAVLLKNATCVRLNSKFTWFKGSKLTENNWEMMVQALNMTAQKMDTHHEGWDSSTVQGFVTNQLAFSKNGIPCYLDFPVLLFFYVFGISLFYDTFFYSVTGQCNFNIQKTIYCDAFNGPQIEQFLQQQQNINFNQPNNNNQFNGMNQGNIGMQPSNQNQGFMHPQQNMGYPQQNMGYPQQNMGYPYNNNYNYGQIMPQQNQMGYPNNMMYNQNQFNMGQPNDNIMLPPQQFDGQNDYSNNQMIPVGNQVK